MTMHKRTLGSTGIEVSAIGMGCMPLSFLVRPPEEESIRTVHAALEHGVTFFDSADAYCLNSDDMGHNERLLAKAIKGHPEALIATKGGSIRPEGRWAADGRPEYLHEACENSLRALEVEAIALYQFHRPDPNVPFSESVGALADLQREGKIVHIGLSNITLEQLEEAREIVPVASVQNRLNLLDRSSMDLLRRCEELNIAFLPYSPLNGRRNAGELAEQEVLLQIADAHHASPQQVALAWLLQLSPVLIPIPGASRSSSIISSAKAADLVLSPSEIAELNGVA